jgi:phosphoenolpyruvate carboxykinase (ATP)
VSRKTPGTEDGVLEPIPTFSTCYSAPFIVLHVGFFFFPLQCTKTHVLFQPGRYAEMLAERMAKHQVNCWLINTGWTGGKFGSGKRCPLKFTRAIVDAVHNGSLAKAEFENFGTFNLSIPTHVEGVPKEVLNPHTAWADKEAFQREVRKLAGMFAKAFALYEKDVEPKVRMAGPQV